MSSVSIIKQTSLPAAGVIIHVVHGQRSFTIHNIHIANTAAVPTKVSVCAVPTGQSANATTALIWDFSLPANDFIEFGEGLKMSPNDSLQAFAETDNSITLFLNGTEE